MKLMQFCVLMIVLSFIFESENKLLGDEKKSDKPRLEQPNVLLFVIDDLGYTDLGCYGSDFYETPEIDQLASRGIRFTNFYSASPVCSPTRAALLTGKSPQRLGITQWIDADNDIHLPADEFTLGEALATAGYSNGYIGKWHLGAKDNQQPCQQGFTWMRAVNRGGQPGSFFFPYHGKLNSPNENDLTAVPNLDGGQVGDYLTDALTDQAITFINENQHRPFFLCLAHYAVHTPIQAPLELVKRNELKLQRRELAESTLAAQPHAKSIDERNGAHSRSRQDNPTYAAMIENLDSNIGRVMQHLEKIGLSDNTIVLFTSDNGGLTTLNESVGPTSCRPLRAGKGWTYEGGIRVPTLVVWPNKIPSAICEIPAITTDLYPTVLELLGLPLQRQQHLDGCSLASLLTLQSPDDQIKEQLTSRFLAWHYPHYHGSGHSPSNAIRCGDWKLIQFTDRNTKPADQFELYDLAVDVGETKNLTQQNPERVVALEKLLQGWLESTAPQ